MKILKNTNAFTLLTKFLVIILPFYVIIKVFFDQKLGAPLFGFFIKELVIILLFLLLAFDYIKKKKLPKFELLDYLIFLYFIYGIGITLVNGLPFANIFYGGRYDFIFLVVFLIFRHSRDIVKISFDKIVKLFLISGSISLILGLSVKFILGEEILQFFGYSIYVADWHFKGGVPIYHGVEASGIRRFQGILDGPNAMGFFLIVYSGLFLHNFRKRLEYHIVLVLIALFVFVIMTYSRSAILGVISGTGVIVLSNLKNIFKKYKNQAISIIILFVLVGGAFGYAFQDKLYNIVIRKGSTSAHLERMETGVSIFLEKPMGHGLATAGPAYRSVHNGEITKTEEEKYIPESWFIQQLMEGGIIYFSLFVSILAIILMVSYKKSRYVFGALVGVLVMNMFLHIFEATYLSILFFIFLGVLNSRK